MYMEQNIPIGYIIMKNKTDCQVIAVKGIQAEGGTFQNFVNATFEKINQIKFLWSRSL